MSSQSRDAQATPRRAARLTSSSSTLRARLGRARITRWHHVLLASWTLAWYLMVERHGGQSWQYFVNGSRWLFGTNLTGSPGDGGGLHLYADHPDLQIGPVSFVVAALFSYLQYDHGRAIAEAVMSGIGLYVLILTGRSASTYLSGRGVDYRRLQVRVLLAGLAFIPMWVEVSVRFAHLDDVLALLFTALAVRAFTQRRASAVGLYLALAVDSKPWAVGFFALVLALPDRRHWWRAIRVALPVIALAWLPFFLGDLNTLTAAKFQIQNSPASALRWLGVHDAGTPSWDRPAQTLLGLALGAIAVRRGRWQAVVLLGANARIALDPSVYTYYTATVLLGTLLWDILGERRLVPLWSWLALASLYGSIFVWQGHPQILGALRLGFVAVSTLYVLFWPIRDAERTIGSGARTTVPAPAEPPTGVGQPAPATAALRAVSEADDAAAGPQPPRPAAWPTLPTPNRRRGQDVVADEVG